MKKIKTASHKTLRAAVMMLRLLPVLLFALTLLVEASSRLMLEKSYELSAVDRRLTGESRDDTRDYLKLNQQATGYEFAIPEQESGGQGEHTGRVANAYSASFATRAKDGISVTDTQSSISVTLVPQFFTRDGQKVEGDHLVYMNGRNKVVYTLKYNGVKEDIIVPEYADDSLEFGFTLRLPSGVEARLDNEGNINIYSSDLTLFGSISFGSDEDRERVEKARENGEKSHLLMTIPAPIVKDAQENVHTDKAVFVLGKKKQGEIKDKQPNLPADVPRSLINVNEYDLHLKASKLKDLPYPISLDPTIQVKAAGDFAGVNLENGTEYDALPNSATLIRRQPLTGGALGSFALEGGGLGTVNGDGLLDSNAIRPGTVVYNGFVYVLGGSSTNINKVRYAQITNEATGDIGAWTSSNLLSSHERSPGAVAYNGYLYVLGGTTASAGSNGTGAVEYAKINSDGSLNSNTCGTAVTWCVTTSLPNAVDGTAEGSTPPASGYGGISVVAHKGFMYVVGGCTGYNALAGQSCNNDQSDSSGAWRAPINANGTVGTWTTSGMLGSGHMPQTMYTYKAGVWNDYLYIVGGKHDGGAGAAFLDTVYYARINSDGSLSGTAAGAWMTTTPMPVARGDFSMTISNGYMYVAAGSNSGGLRNDVIYAQINADGTLGAWKDTGVTVAVPLWDSTAIALKNGIVVLGGNDGNCGANDCRKVQYAAFKTAGALHEGTWVNSTDNPTLSGALPAARARHATTVYNGYIYAIGGCSNCDNVVSAGMASTVYYAQINADGSLATDSDGIGACTTTWCTTTALPADRAGAVAVAYGGYMFVMGGCTTDACNTTMVGTTYYGAIADNGTIAAWNVEGDNNPVGDTGMIRPRGFFTGQAYNGNLYAIGGCWDGGISASCANHRLDHVEHAAIDLTACATAAIGCVGTWTADGTFTNARTGLTSVILGNYLYIAGGNNSSTIYGDVQYARITSGGALDNNTCGTATTWCTTQSLQTARLRHGMAVSNGYVYVFAGCDGIGAANPNRCEDHRLVSTEFARINSDGTLDPWQYTKDANYGKYYFGYAAVNGVIYTVGGEDDDDGGATLTRTNYQYLNNGGRGTLANWSTGTTTGGVTTRSAHGAVAYNGYLYMAGGCGSWAQFLGLPYCATPRVNIYRAPINADGSLGTWATTTTGMPPGNTLYTSYALTVHNGYLYMAGGGTGGDVALQAATSINTVYSIPINASTGDISGAWATLPAMNTNRFGITNGSAILNGRWYVASGCTAAGTGCVNTIEFATFQPNGGLSTWQQNGNQTLTTGRNNHGLVANGNYLYVLGGCPANCASGFANDVEYTEVTDSGGFITNAWTRVASSEPVGAGGAYFSYNGYLYAAASLSGVSATSQRTLIAPLLASGGVGRWQHNGNTAGSLIGNNRILSAGVIWGGRLYVTGGTNDAITVVTVSTHADTMYTTIQSIQRTGSFSKRYDFDAGVKPTKLVTRGTKQTGAVVSLDYGMHAATGTVITSVSPVLDALLSNGHGLTLGEPIIFRTTGTLPGGLVGGREYYAAPLDANTFLVTTVPGDAGTVVNITTTGTGTLTFINPGILSNRQRSGNISYGGGNAQSISLSNGTTLIEYLYVRYTIDDAYSAAFPDEGRQTNISDFDAYYTSNPGKRLRGGRTFTNGVDRGLGAQP